MWGLHAYGQHGATILHWVRALSSAEQLPDMRQIIYIPLGGTRSPVTLLFTSLTAYICSLNSRRLGDKDLFSTNKTQDMEGLLCLGGPCTVLLSFSSTFSMILLNFRETGAD